jgi:hypothetical protein
VPDVAWAWASPELGVALVELAYAADRPMRDDRTCESLASLDRRHHVVAWP